MRLAKPCQRSQTPSVASRLGYRGEGASGQRKWSWIKRVSGSVGFLASLAGPLPTSPQEAASHGYRSGDKGGRRVQGKGPPDPWRPKARGSVPRVL